MNDGLNFTATEEELFLSVPGSNTDILCNQYLRGLLCFAKMAIKMFLLSI